MIALYIVIAIMFYAAVCTVYNIYSEADIPFPKRLVLSDKTAVIIGAAGGILTSAALFVSRNDIDIYGKVLFGIELAFLAVIAVIDIKKHIIPNKLLLAMLGCWVVYTVVLLAVDTEQAVGAVISSIGGMVFALIVFGTGYLLMRSKLGGGDVKAMILLGLIFTGRAAFGVIMYSLVFSVLFALGAIISGKMKVKDTMPFAPFMLLGTIAAVALY